jgi:hypothetical protein
MQELTRKYLDRLRAAQMPVDRFHDAHWYIGAGDELHTIIYDARDLEGDGPSCHGMVCMGAVLEDARLRAAAPGLLQILVDLVEQIDAYEVLHGQNTCAIDPDAARAAIAKMGFAQTIMDLEG